MTTHPANNVPENIYEKIGTNLHQQPDHPIAIIKQAIYEYFARADPAFKTFDNLHPIVSVQAVGGRVGWDGGGGVGVEGVCASPASGC